MTKKPPKPPKASKPPKKTYTKAEQKAVMGTVALVTDGFFPKVRPLIGKLPFVPDAVAMYFVMIDIKTPFWVKAAVASALLYFISPVDAVPDITPPFPVGYADDAAVIMATLEIVHEHIEQRHRDQARAWLKG